MTFYPQAVINTLLTKTDSRLAGESDVGPENEQSRVGRGVAKGNEGNLLNGGVLMRSELSFKRLQTRKERLKAKPLPPRHDSENPSFLFATEKLRWARLARFIHGDLDMAIALLSETQNSDPSLITRLKKCKLQLKDEITLIERLV